MKSWITIIVGGALSWHFTDLQSDSFFQGAVCPILLGVFAIAFLTKLMFWLGSGGRGRGGDGSSGGGGIGSDSGGWGGDGGCGGGD